MKRFFLFFFLMVIALFAVSQTKVVFTGAMLNGSYCPFEEVKVTNITKGWTETLVYPDTVLILSGLGVEEVAAPNEGIIRVYPNPFKDFTNVEFSVPESGWVEVCVVGVDGVKVASWEGYLQSGIRQLRVTLEKPQMAFVVITTEKERYVGKLLHVGGGGINEIDVRSASPMFSERSNGLTRSGGDFTPGDMMSYEGVLQKCLDTIYSDKVTQAQYVDETITLAFPVSGIGGEVQSLPYYQSFENDFGTYLVYNEMGAKSWKIDYNSAMMTGYDSGTYYANIDWLISSPVDLTNVTDAKMIISYICRYFHFIDEDITIWASTDYTWCDIPTNASWTQLPAILTEGNNWNDFTTTEVALTEFVGQIVTVAVKYTSTDNNAGTIEIQSILIEEDDGPTPPGPGVEIQSLPYYQSFANEFGTYMTYDVLGPQSWEIDYATAKMSGYANSTNYANIDWLISSPVAITDVNDTKMTMSYIGRYFNNINDEVTIWASTDYTWGDDPTNVTWIQVPASLTTANNWNDFVTTEIALTEFVGQTVTLAVKYTSSDIKAGTIEVQSITIEEGSAGGGPTPPGPGGDVQVLPYIQSFTSEFGTYMTYDVLGPQSWEIDYATAKMSGYANSTNYANIDWLISSPVAITDVDDAKMTMNYIGRYFNNINDEVTVWASTDYTWGDNPSNVTWIQVPASLTTANNWNDFVTTEIALTEFVGQTVTLAVKYTSSDIKAGTIEVQSITIEEGSAGGGPTPPGPGTGSGTADDPYNVAAGIGLQDESPVAWVHGYIVGAVKSGLNSVSSNDDINWNAPFDLVTNVLIADDPACHEISQCIIVNLPAGKPLRTAVNLVDHPENLGKQLSVLGKLRRYFGQAGLRDSNGTEADFVLEGVTPPNPGTEIFSETFATGQGGFTIQDVVLPSELSYVWQHAPSYSCMKASAYVGQAFNAESWLVSPAIDLSGVSDATLTFEQAINYAAPQGVLAMMISTNYNGDVTTATWNELNLDQWPAGNNWTFITSSADLSPYVGQQVTIAFKYTSSTSASATWEVKNFVVE